MRSTTARWPARQHATPHGDARGDPGALGPGGVAMPAQALVIMTEPERQQPHPTALARFRGVSTGKLDGF